MSVSHRLASGFLLVGGCLVLSACSSIKSRIYDVDGVTSGERQVKRLRGIPTTIDVPTHVRITIEETKYFGNNAAAVVKQNALEEKKANLKSVIDVHTATINTETETIATAEKVTCSLNAEVVVDQVKKKAEMDKIDTARQRFHEARYAIIRPKLELKQVEDLIAEVNDQIKSKPTMLHINATRQMSYELITQKELYTVDFKRPISGSNDLKLEFGDRSGGQFLKSVGQTTVDTSITDIGDLVEKTAAALPKLLAISKKAEDDANATAAKNEAKGLFSISGVVAVQCFDIRDPMLDEKIQQFLEQYINNCHPGCPPYGVTHSMVQGLVQKNATVNTAIVPASHNPTSR